MSAEVPSPSPYPEEVPGGASETVRDFTRRHGMIDGIFSFRDGIRTISLMRIAGGYYEPVDSSSVQTIMTGGLRRVDIPEGVTLRPVFALDPEPAPGPTT